MFLLSSYPILRATRSHGLAGFVPVHHCLILLWKSLYPLEYKNMQKRSESCQQLQAVELENLPKIPSARKSRDGRSEAKLRKDERKELISEIAEDEKANDLIKPENPGQEQDKQQPPEPPFSIFTPRERRFIVVMASLAALFSPLAANIYYPALNTLSKDLHESLSKINLTITTYLVRSWTTLVVTRAHCVTDFPGASTDIHRQPFRRDRSTTILHNLFRRLHRRKYWSGIA